MALYLEGQVLQDNDSPMLVKFKGPVQMMIFVMHSTDHLTIHVLGLRKSS